MLHKSVLLQEVIQYLDPQEGDFVIDGTVDGGGHAAAILEKIAPDGILLGLDWDKQMLELARKRTAEILNPSAKGACPSEAGRRRGSALGGKSESLKVILEEGNYADLPEILRKHNLPKADGLLLDLGFSSEQLEQSGRGFSFAGEEPLIMTYDDKREPVRNILRRLNEKELAEIIFKFGGERYSKRIARAIHERERMKPIVTTKDLREIIVNAVPKNYERGRIDPATRTFQALRIYANDELGNLEQTLKNLPKILKSGGRAVIVSFHSLEDRIIKNVFRDYAKAGQAEILTKKPIVPSEEEIKNNPRSRSAKLRAARVVANNADNGK